MSSHNRTPQRVLDAPICMPVAFVEHQGLTRHERRHGVHNPGLKPVEWAARLKIWGSTPNVPYVRTTARRGRRVRRWAVQR